MRLTVRSKQFPNFGTDNRAHFLLTGATLACAVSFENGTTTTLTATRTAPSTFVVDIGPTQVPDLPAAPPGVPGKLLITRIELDYRVPVTLGGLAFTALRIVQRLIPTPRDAAARDRVEYILAAGGWLDTGGRQRVANLSVHPLVDLANVTTGEVLLNTLMLDLTPGWRQLHASNQLYQEYDMRSRGRGLTFKVFAYTSGIPLIWYAVVPDQLRGDRFVSPHIFLQPSDNREGQAPADDSRYLLNNARYFDTDGGVLMKYILPPIPDVLVPSLGPPVVEPERKRNVVNFSKAVHGGRETGEITTGHWNIGAGLQKAFEHIGGGVPSQFLLLPQRVGTATSGGSGSYGAAVSTQLPTITNALFGVIESNTDLTLGGADVLLRRDKLVISAYSESGYDLWHVSQANRDWLKAIIAIEPQNMNSVQNDYRPRDSTAPNVRIGPPPLLGKDVIPELLKRKVLVYVIGRHHLQYGPQIPDRSKVRLLPPRPADVFRYPPDPAVNDFIKYRVHRMTAPSEDPLMLPEETASLAALAARGITGAAVLPVIFGVKGNQDQSVNDGVDRWYSHNFALTGGEEMHLDPAGVYGRPVAYNTWFQFSVHEVG